MATDTPDILDDSTGPETNKTLGLYSRLLQFPTPGDDETLSPLRRSWFLRNLGASPPLEQEMSSCSRRSEVNSLNIGQATPTIATPLRLGQQSMIDDVLTPAHDTTFRPDQRHELHTTQLLEDTILGVDTTTLDDPTIRVSGDLIVAFHREFSRSSRPAQCLDMAMALEKCCEVQLSILSDYEKQTRLSVDQLQAELCMEMATWQLLYVLARDRIEDRSRGDNNMVDILSGCGVSDKEIAEQLFVRDSSVRQTQLVVDWLEGLARSGLEKFSLHAAYYTGNVCWENTLHDIKHGNGRDVLVTELDPDALTRQRRKLSELDLKDQLSSNKHILMFLRAGQFDKAQEVCVKSGNAWMAMTMQGWRLFHDPNKDKDKFDSVKTTEGNKSRDLWKYCCLEMIEESSYDIYERAIYATLCGNVDKVLPTCLTWYDFVWAYFKRLVDVEVEKELRRRVNRDMMKLPAHYWSNVLLPNQIFQEIETKSSTDVKRQCQSHFHLIQKYIILDDLNGLVEEMVKWLSSKPTIHRLRFMAHIALVARGLGGLIEENKVDVILEAYVKALTYGDYQSQVALYTAQLTNETYSYAHFLEGVQEEYQQRHCLQLGREAGIDIVMATKAVVENIMKSAEQDGGQCIGSQELDQLTLLDQKKIMAINWLLYDKTQRPEAIKQCNALVRQFLTTRKYSAAQAIFHKLPADSVEVVIQLWQHKASPLPQYIVSNINQLHAITTYLEAKELFNTWFQHNHYKKPKEPVLNTHPTFHDTVAFEYQLAQYKQEYEQWKSEDKILTEEASTKLYAVLLYPGGWMSSQNETEDDEHVLQQLKAVRQTCIPEVCFLFHSVLHSTANYLKCIEICNIVMSEENKHYQDFRPAELKLLLKLKKNTALACACDPTTSELGYPLE